MAETGKERAARFRDRRRAGVVTVNIGVGPSVRYALVRLGLIENGHDDDRQAVAWAAERFLETAAGVAKIGEALYPEPPGDAQA